MLNNLNYKHRIIICIFSLLTMACFLFGIYLHNESVYERKDAAGNMSKTLATQVGRDMDSCLLRIKNYYFMEVSDDAIGWVFQNDMDYSDVTYIQDALTALRGEGIISDYISGFTLINFRTNWVLSNKGMHRADSLLNIEDVEELFQFEQNFADNYWSCRKDGSDLSRLDSNRRLTANLDHLSLIMKFPHNLNAYGMLIINVDENAIYDSFTKYLDTNEYLAVLDEDGDVCYTNNQQFGEALQSQIAIEGGKIAEAGDYIIAKADSSSVLRSYYVGIDWNAKDKQYNSDSVFYIFISLLLLLLSCLSMVYALYDPISRLTKHVAKGENTSGGGYKIPGKELQNIAARVEDLIDDNTSLTEKVAEQQRQAKELFGLRLIRGELLKENLEEHIEQLKMEGKNFYALMVTILRFPENAEGIDEHMIYMRINQNIPQNLVDELFLPPIYHMRAIVFMIADNNQNRLLDHVMNVYDQFRDYVMDNFHVNIGMGVSSTYKDIFLTNMAYVESCSALNNYQEGEGGYEEASHLYFYLENNNEKGEEQKERRDYEKEMQNAILAMDKEMAYEVIGSFINSLRTQRMDKEEAIILLTRMTNVIIIKAMEEGISIGNTLTDDISVVYQRITQFYDYERIRRYIKRVVIDPILFALSTQHETKSYTIMEEIRNLIVERKGNLTLSECAEALNYHPTYIWKILKMETDKSFSDYLEDYKIQRAKALLSETNMTVAEIAEELNYTNAQNFIRFFSKVTGTTPGKYRQSIK